MSIATKALCGVIIGSLVAAATGTSQGGRVAYGFGAGLVVPNGEFHNAAPDGAGYNSGWEGMALVEFNLPQTSIGARFEGSYSQNSANDQLKADLSAVVGAPADSKAKILGGSVDLTFEFRSSSPYSSPRATAYVLGGVGMYNFKLSVSSGNVTADTSATKFTWNAGGGLRYSVGRAALFLEVRYFDISSPFGSDIKFVPIIVGVRFGRN
jgi:opacity protein-like surface antigen